MTTTSNPEGNVTDIEEVPRGAASTSEDREQEPQAPPVPSETFRQYRRSQIALLADWHPGFDMTGVSVSDADRAAGSPKQGDKIARNPANHDDRWLVAADYFAANFEPLRPAPLPQEPAQQGERCPKCHGTGEDHATPTDPHGNTFHICDCVLATPTPTAIPSLEEAWETIRAAFRAGPDGERDALNLVRTLHAAATEGAKAKEELARIDAARREVGQ
jgi:hypothetical protein